MDEPWVCEECNYIQYEESGLYVCDTCAKEYCEECEFQVMHTRLYYCCGCKKAFKRWKKQSAHRNAIKHLQCFSSERKAFLRKEITDDETCQEKECPIKSETTPSLETVEDHIESMMQYRTGCEHCGFHKEWVQD